MEQDRSSTGLTPGAVRATLEASLVDSLFGLPEGFLAKRASKAETSRLEAQLAAEMRKLIAARLGKDEA